MKITDMHANFLFLITVALGLATTASFSDTASPAAVTASAVAPAATAPTSAENLVVFNRKVFSFRAAVSGVSALDRAHRAQARIAEQLELDGPKPVTTVPDTFGIGVRVGGATSFWVTPGDLDPQRDDTLEQTATKAANALKQVIAESAESRNMAAMLWAGGKALAATLAMLAIVWTASKLRRALARRLAAASEKHASRVKVGGLSVLQPERASYAVRWSVIWLYRLFLLVVLSEWLSYVLMRFPYTRTWGESLSSFLFDLAARMLMAAVGALPDLLAAVVIFYLAYLATKVLDRFFANVQTDQLQIGWLDADILVPTRRIAKVIVWIFALAMAYPYLPGSQTEAFKGLSVLIGLMVSLGASSLVGQAASGLILTFGRVYRKGEFVRVGTVEGTVMELGMFTTRIRTGLGEELTVSNSSVLADTTVNYSRAVKGSGFVVDTTVTIGYDTPWRQVHAMLEEAAKRTPGVLEEPAPVVFQTALSDWYPQYRLVCQALPSEPRPRAVVLSALHANIQDVFNEYGVQIMSPQYFEDPSEPKVVPRERWFTAPAKE
ncbi:MAG: mechanosensitive ion channel family protein [Comamonadaceae bacterium]|nr:mechanosensitive ion channel family protein [Comamonadaceae bacterium]